MKKRVKGLVMNDLDREGIAIAAPQDDRLSEEADDWKRGSGYHWCRQTAF